MINELSFEYNIDENRIYACGYSNGAGFSFSVAGNIGSDRMLQYSTIGDTVNVASRLEQRNKEFSTEILFSHEIYTSLTKDLYNRAKYQGEISLKGRDTKTRAYSI